MLSLLARLRRLITLATSLRNHQSNATQVILVKLILGIHATRNRIRPVVEQVVVQLTVAPAKLLLLQEQAVVHQGQGIEHIQFGLLGQNEGIVDEGIESRFERRPIRGGGESSFCGVVEEVGNAEDFIVLDDG